MRETDVREGRLRREQVTRAGDHELYASSVTAVGSAVAKDPSGSARTIIAAISPIVAVFSAVTSMSLDAAP